MLVTSQNLQMSGTLATNQKSSATAWSGFGDVRPPWLRLPARMEAFMTSGMPYSYVRFD